MPELPEVSHLVDYIHKNCVNKKIEKIKIIKGRYKKSTPNNFKDFSKSLPMKLTEIKKKGKVIFFNFENKWWIISKLGLMGWWYINDEKPEWMRGDSNIIFKIGNSDLHYHDIMSYGTLNFTNDINVVNKEINKLAPEITDIKINDLLERLDDNKKISKKHIEEIILEQTILFSGVGNYLKSEILYEAKISPKRIISKMTKDDWINFLKSAKVVCRRKNKSIGNVNKYMETMLVYRKEFDPLGNEVKKYTADNGRTTYWVPKLQK